jgi:hypothetical protein
MCETSDQGKERVIESTLSCERNTHATHIAGHVALVNKLGDHLLQLLSANHRLIQQHSVRERRQRGLDAAHHRPQRLVVTALLHTLQRAMH